MKNTNDDDKYKEGTLKHQYSNESFDNPKTSDTSRNESFINTTKEEESLIKWLMTINFKRHAIQYVVDIVISCGEN